MKSSSDKNYYEYLRKKSIKCAEVLIPYEIPYDYVTCAAVVNEKTQRRLEEIGFKRTIEVVPNLFFKEMMVKIGNYHGV